MHRNSHQNKRPHHLYEIYDEQEEEAFKYGISSDPIDEDGRSARMERQVDLLRACLKFVFEVENGQIWVLAKRFLSCIAALRSEKKAMRGSIDEHLQTKG